MEVPLYVRSATSVRQTMFTLRFERENIGATYAGDMACLTIQGYLRYERPPETFVPALVGLSGALYGGTTYLRVGATLLDVDELPLAFDMPGDERFVNLLFGFPGGYLRQIEAERAAQSVGSDMKLTLRLRGSVAMRTSVPSTNQKGSMPLIAGVAAVSTDTNGRQLNIPHSDWIRLLTLIGYPQKRVVELPVLDATTMPPEVQEAIKHVSEALTLFASDRYREAVQRCRQARDALIGTGRDKVTWCEENLSGPLGEKKAMMVDDGLKALNHLGNVASHAGKEDGQIEVDRDTAEYVMGQLTYILNYIGRKLR